MNIYHYFFLTNTVHFLCKKQQQKNFAAAHLEHNSSSMNAVVNAGDRLFIVLKTKMLTEYRGKGMKYFKN